MYVIERVHKASHLLKQRSFLYQIYVICLCSYTKNGKRVHAHNTHTSLQIVLYMFLYEKKITLMVEYDWPSFFILLLRLLLLCTC